MILSHSRVRAYSFDNMSRQILFLVFLSAKKLYLKITGKPVQPFGFYVLLPSLMRLLYKKRVPTVLLASDTWKTHRPVSCILFCTCSCCHIFAAVAGERFFSVTQHSKDRYDLMKTSLYLMSCSWEVLEPKPFQITYPSLSVSVDWI